MLIYYQKGTTDGRPCKTNIIFENEAAEASPPAVRYEIEFSAKDAESARWLFVIQ